MAALFDPARHQSLEVTAWDCGKAQDAIERIVADTRESFTSQGLWQIHPNDREGDERGPHAPLYFGAAGVIWGLDHLVREGAAEPGRCFSEFLPEIYNRNRQVLEEEAWRNALGPGWQTRSWLLGDSGILFTQWKTSGSDEVLPLLADRIAANTDDPALELMWGAPGTMLCALELYRSTGASQWKDLYRAGAKALEDSFHPDEALGAHMWTQVLYGRSAQYLGPVHGYAGNAYALTKGGDYLGEERWARLSSQIARTLEVTAIRSSEGVNWGAVAGTARSGAPALVQHCHGAPGMVTALAGLDEPIDELLLGGGELTWKAGPLAKGSNLCHGTAGNGFAFLKLFERTGDGMWLDRARLFAMHAIKQSDMEAAHFGQRRFSLWTGDIGLACFLLECVRATARFPTFDVL
ncbi:lanthionine synthetase C family protein [Microvirga rosea]|uniref:lanthionine synthetase C family protein n=1 Tax=Microvirga rosea TaxID=2715425 RepID=UPI001D09EA41|nr:LanC-like protein [Microvirga rosea]MCB8819934.1 LanC-like protein [Microvirga rosea]